MVQEEAVQFLQGYPEHRVRLKRNVTIRGELPHTLWDLAFLKRRIGLEADVVVTLESLFITNGRQPSATSFGSLDIFSVEVSAALVIRNCTLVYPLCVPISLAFPYTTKVPRPSGFPGTQSARLTGPKCFPDVNFSPNCYDESMLLVDLTTLGSTLDSSGTRYVAGVLAEYNTTYVCEATISVQCITNKAGTTNCAQLAMEKYRLLHWENYDLFAQPPLPPFPPAPPPEPPSPPMPPPPPHPPPPEPSSAGAPVLAIVLPSVLGGLAVLAALAGAAWWWWRRRRREAGGWSSGPGPGTGQQNGLGSKAPKDASRGSATDRCGAGAGGLGPGPDLHHQRIQLEVGGAAPTGAGAVANGALGALQWTGSGSGINPKWSDRADAGTGGGGAAAAAAGGGAAKHAPQLLPGVRRSPTMSSAHSGCTAGRGGQASNGGVSPGVGVGVGLGSGTAAVDYSLLGNPLLAPPGGKGSGCSSSGPGIALNMVLGVDVFASREAVVGRGSFATVLEGQLGGRPVAVKLFHRDALGGTAEDVKSLKQEIAILARCQHPNVVALLGAGSTTGGDEVFLVEELMISNLARACHEGQGLPLPRVLSVARDVAAGLAYLHPTVIHRDLKPANVLLDQYGTAKLTDFGLSRLWASTVHTANPEAGTVQYMAPECFSSITNDNAGKTPISHLSDIYSFGVLLWEMLTRERPWKGLNSIQVALAVGFQQHRLSIPDTDNERFHPKLRKLILQCWDADPRKRPGAAEIAKRLSLLLQHLETHGSLSAPCGHSASIAGSLGSDTAIVVGAAPVSVGGGPSGSGGAVSAGPASSGPDFSGSSGQPRCSPPAAAAVTATTGATAAAAAAAAHPRPHKG